MRLINDKDLGLIDGRMDRSILATGRTMWRLVMESFFMKMEMSMKATGKRIKLMDMESILRRMESSIRDSGRMISSMEKVLRYGVRMLSMKETFLWVKKQELES
jgi:hypothetical protein